MTPYRMLAAGVKTFIACATLSLFFSCNKANNDDDDSGNMPSDSTVTASAPAHVLVLGTAGDSLVYWKDDTMHFLHKQYNIQSYSLPGQMIADGQDIYIAGGSENDKAVTYKNFVKTIVDPTYSYASSIAVSGGHVYAAGFSLDFLGNNYGETYMTSWKDGIRTSDYVANTQYDQVFLYNNDVYLIGFRRSNTGYGYGSMVFKKNNVNTPLSNFNSEARRMALRNDSAFVVGNIYFNNYQSHATLWVGGQEISLHSLTDISSANAVFLKGNDVYVAGSINGYACYWKNGVGYTMGFQGEPWDIKVTADNKVYAVGSYTDQTTFQKVAVLWKNNTVTVLGTPNHSTTAFSLVLQ